MNKKYMVHLIKKIAQELEDAPGVTPKRTPAPAVSPTPPNLPPPPAPPIGTPVPTEPTPATTPAETPKPAFSGSSGIVSPNVAKMQTELKNLATALTAQVDMKGLSGPEGKLGPNATPEQQNALGRMSFADFITQHYTRDSDIPGVELDWDPSKTKIEDKDPSKPTRTNVVMDTMQRIGNPTLPGHKPEFAIDGNWGPRTNVSLRNAYAMAFGLLEMAKQFGFRSHAYSSRDLAALKEMIPATSQDISFQEKDKRAKEIIPQLKAIRNLFQDTQEHILNKTEFTPYIEGTQAYMTYGPSNVPDASKLAELNKKFSSLKIVGNVDGRSITLPITVSDLISPDTLIAWQQRNLPNLPPINILAQVKQYLDNIDPAKGETIQ